MKIKNMLLTGSGISIALVLMFSWIVYVSFSRVAEENERELIAQEVHKTVSELDLLLYEYLTHRGERMLQQWNLRYDATREIIEKTDQSWGEVKSNYADLAGLFSRIIENYAKGGGSELEKRLITQFLIKSQAIIDNSSTIAKEAYSNAIEAQSTANNIMKLALIVLFVTLIGLSLHTARQITNPLDKLITGTQIIGKGNLDHKVSIKTKNEIGSLAAAFNQMTEDITKVTASRNELNAANQQLQAGEQQLKASNQQLRANEQQLRASEQALRNSEERIRLMVSEVKDYAILMLDPNGKIASWNEGAQHIKGYTAEEIMGKHFSCFYPEDDVNSGKPDDELKAAFAKGRFEDEGWRIRKDGSKFWANVIITAMRNDAGELKGYSKVTRDITERKQAEGALQKAYDELEIKVTERTKELSESNLKLKELDKLKSMFMASMSHELRTPLNSIIGFTGVVLQGMSGDITEEQTKQLTMVKSSATYLLSLINDIIDVSKIETDNVEIYIENLDISALIREINDSFKVAAKEKGIKLSVKIPDKLVMQSDERRVKQIIMNFVSNAVKFTTEGEVEVEALRKNDNLEISVRDTGPGIKKEDMNKLFKSFSRIPIKGKTVEGTGLGLYLSKKLVDLLEGSMSAESEFGSGSKFKVVLPLKYTGIKT